jgi:protocatechuate 3,4-dioxygenase beta subunit
MRVSSVVAFALVVSVVPVLSAQVVTTFTPINPGQVVQPGQPTPGQPAPGQPTQPQRMPARPLRPGELPPKGTAVIRGQVIAAGTGTPIRRAQVRAMSPEARGNGVTSTDAEGRFEIKELPAGRYTVSAAKSGFVTTYFGSRRAGDPGTPIEIVDGMAADKVNFQLPRGAVIAGRVFDDNGEPMAGVQVSAMRNGFQAGSRRMIPAGAEGGNDRTDDQGGYRLYGLPPGDYYVSATYRGQMIMGPEINNTQSEGFAPTYYPGTPNLAEAQRLSPKANQEISGVNFSMLMARMARVSGRALNSKGEPARSMVMLTPLDAVGGMMFMTGGNMAGPDGSFQIPNVAAGRYLLNVRPMGMPGPNDEFVALPITVGSEDIENVIVSTAVGGTARGVVITDTGEPPPFRADQIQVFASPLEPLMMPVGNGGPARVNDDFSFELTSVFDRRMIRASLMSPTPGWYFKEVRLEGEDVTDAGIEFAPGRHVEGLQIVYTQKATDLSGLVTDARSKPVLDASIVIFSANRDKWRFNSRYVRTLRPDTNGRYTTRGLPPDDYLVIAVQNLESGQGGDPEFLARAREEARPLTLSEGETKALDVKLSSLVP